jgi:hypothetical protein
MPVLVRKRVKAPPEVSETSQIMMPVYGEVALDGKNLCVWNGEAWLDMNTVMDRLRALEARVVALEASFRPAAPVELPPSPAPPPHAAEPPQGE